MPSGKPVGSGTQYLYIPGRVNMLCQQRPLVPPFMTLLFLASFQNLETPL